MDERTAKTPTADQLEKRDSLVFEAILPNNWRNPFDEQAELLPVLETLNGSREPVRRHFADYASIWEIIYQTADILSSIMWS